MGDSSSQGVSALIVDDHPLIRDAVRNTLAALEPASRIDTADSFAAATRLLESETDWDFALLDLHLPDCEGFDGLKAFRDLRPGLPTIVLSGRTDRETILKCIDLGAAGYIPKTSHSDTISDALQLVATGHVYLPREALGHEAWPVRSGPLLPAGAAEHATTIVADHTAIGVGTAGAAPGQPRPAPAQRVDPRSLGLTGRQCDVLRLMLNGLPNKLICRRLDLAEGTVKVHVSAVLRALGVRNRTQAVVAVSQMGLCLSPSSDPDP
ncbi:MAG: response regulator transcription factor [Burkholderiaceae bacterium]